MEDDENKRLLKKAETGYMRGIDPHLVDQLKRKIEADQKKKEVQQNQKKALEGLQKDQEALKKDMEKRGVQQSDKNQNLQQLIDAAKRQQVAEKAQGGTEQATGSVG